tara:strand:- start:946 stop:1599 length:654 start_codon:yes stop_codon:yes gene_type:complete
MYGLTKKEYEQYVLLKQNASRFQQRSTTTFNEVAYKKKWVTTKKNIGTKENPNLVWWDRKTKSAYDINKVSSAHIDQEYKSKYNTLTPLDDLKYLEAKYNIGRTEAAIKGKLGPLSNLRSDLSIPLEGGGLEIDVSRKEKLTKQKKDLPGLLEKSSYWNKPNDNSSTNNKSKVPVLFKTNQTIDFSYISNPQNREIAKSLHRQLNETKASIVGEYFT